MVLPVTERKRLDTNAKYMYEEKIVETTIRSDKQTWELYEAIFVDLFIQDTSKRDRMESSLIKTYVKLIVFRSQSSLFLPRYD